MRSSKSRSRNKSNRNRNTNTLGNVVNRVFDSSGPEGKVRGTPQQIIDKYNQLARDASLGNDRVAAENFQQHAEHYMRMLSEAQREQDARREQQERENRERQAQRDRDRTQRESSDQTDKPERSDRADRSDKQDKPVRAAPEPKPDTSAPVAVAADVVDLGSDDDGPGLVDTPESRSQAQPVTKPAAAPTKAKAPVPDTDDGATKPAAADAPVTPAAADAPAEPAAEEKPKKPRAPRKPRKKPEPKPSVAASENADTPPPAAADTPPADAAE